MNRHQGTNELLALLGRLKGALQDFTAREEKLGGEFRARSAAELKAFEAATQEQSDALAGRLAGTESAFANERKKLQDQFDHRKARITQAHLVCNREVSEGTDRPGRRKQNLERSAMDAESNRQTQLADNTARLEQFKAGLAENYAGLGSLEKSVRSAFRGYAAFRRLLSPRRPWPEPVLPPEANELFTELRGLETATRGELDRFVQFQLPRIFKFLPPWLFTLLLLLGWGAWTLLQHQPGTGWSFSRETGIALATVWIILFVVHQLGKFPARPVARTIAANLARARLLHDRSLARAESQWQQEQDRIQQEFEDTTRTLNQQWKQTLKEDHSSRGTRAQAVDEKGFRIMQKNERIYRAKLELGGTHRRGSNRPPEAGRRNPDAGTGRRA